MSVVWIISDGKQGHYNQSLGLCDALQRLRPRLQVETIAPFTPHQNILLAMGFALQDEISTLHTQAPPSMIVCAGHSTHFTALTLGWRLKVKALVLMKPSFPPSWFDLCLIPAHDQPASARNIIATRGALNPMRPDSKKPNTGIILIGGPSKHHHWDEQSLFDQLNDILTKDQQDWLITTSRRTPDSTLNRLYALQNVTFVPHTKTPQGWLAAQLATTEYAWVTADSVSMVYEALTAGCAVGVLDVQERQSNRLTRGIQALSEEGTITLYSQWTQKLQLSKSGVFNEADRCADEILKRGWL